MRVRDENKEITIREKAIELIVKEGFNGFSMQKLAKGAHVSPATIYIYYKNKEEMLNKLFMHVRIVFWETAMVDFHPEMQLEEGLLQQWKNRFHFILAYPMHFQFMEQFRNSPLIKHKDVDISQFKVSMKAFIKNAISRNEMKKMEPEIFWAIAYGSFYSLVKFHLDDKSMMGRPFEFTETKIKQAVKLVTKALNP